jgi:subtilisin family serine protease
MKMRLLAMVIAAGCVAACGGSSAGGGGGGGNVATFSVGVTVSNLSGSGMVLQLNGSGNLSVPASGFYIFPNRLTSGASYNVTVFIFPASPIQACAVSNGSGVIGVGNVSNVIVNCTNGFTLGGTVSGMSGTGLVLQNNGGANLPIAGNGPFTFQVPVASGATYSVTTFSNTPTQTCAIANATGTATANVSNVAVTCTLGFNVTASGPLDSQQWHLKNTGQAAFADTGGVAGIDINVEPVYLGFGYSGQGVIAAVVDSGLEIAHEDLSANVIPGGSWNFINSTTDPTNAAATSGDHGTSVAGLIAAARNSLGGLGVAPTAGLKGFNLLSAQNSANFLDSLGGSTANPKSDDVFVFNQSFGISTNTPIKVVPSEEAQYLAGVTSLRGALGALYVKAAGNGFNGVAAVTCPPTGLSCENANFDPTNTLPYQIVVGATNASGIKASYSTAGSAIWVSAPGGEFGLNTALFGAASPEAFQPAMITTDQSGCAKGFAKTGVNTSTFNNGGTNNGGLNASCNYTNTMNGTSSATPVTVGAIALILQANPALTWRDVKHILASTARQVDASRPAVNVTLSDGTYVAEPAWTINAAGFAYHDWYGFGMIDVSNAVNVARAYVSALGTFVDSGFISSPALSLPIPDNSVVGASNGLAVAAGTASVIEAVQIRVNITHTFLGDLSIELTSPSGTRSVLKNVEDGYADAQNFVNQVFLSNAFYGENPVGTWTIKVVDGLAGDTGTLTSWAIRVYGH